MHVCICCRGRAALQIYLCSCTCTLKVCLKGTLISLLQTLSFVCCKYLNPTFLLMLLQKLECVWKEVMDLSCVLETCILHHLIWQDKLYRGIGKLRRAESSYCNQIMWQTLWEGSENESPQTIFMPFQAKNGWKSLYHKDVAYARKMQHLGTTQGERR